MGSANCRWARCLSDKLAINCAAPAGSGVGVLFLEHPLGVGVPFRDGKRAGVKGAGVPLRGCGNGEYVVGLSVTDGLSEDARDLGGGFGLLCSGADTA